MAPKEQLAEWDLRPYVEKLGLKKYLEPIKPGEMIETMGEDQIIETMGVQPRFRPKNDLEASGRKIAGLGVCRDASGGMLFHTSLLVDLDVEQLTRVLVRLEPFEVEAQGKKLRVAFSAGWKQYEPGEQASDLIEAADQNLYRNKSGRKSEHLPAPVLT